MHHPLRTTGSLLLLALWLALIVAVRCWNSGSVFMQGHTFYVDADCYSRMTRVARVYEHPSQPVHFHEFENWPQGVVPHTTAPFDYLTAGLALAFRPFSGDAAVALDRAGAWVSPLLVVLTGLALWIGGGRGRYAALLYFAVSPMLVHGTALGRPDHQSLILLCMAVALRAELALLEKEGEPNRAWAVAGGLAWGLGLWTSLYEPLILWVIATALSLSLLRRSYFCRARRDWALALAAVLLAGLAVDGWPSAKLAPEVSAYFANWSRTVGELNHAALGNLAGWAGWLVFAAPLLLAWAAWRQRDRRCLFCLGLLLATTGLTVWQGRWGYFFALAFVLALPPMLAPFYRKWQTRVGMWAVLIVCLWPIGREWDRMLDTFQNGVAADFRAENAALYNVAQWLRANGGGQAVLAPWWQSPALAYWSGLPCVAGSSHESMPGIVDSARFYMSPPDGASGAAILERRGAGLVVVYDAARVESVCSAILGQPVPKGETLVRHLFERPNTAPGGYRLLYTNLQFRVFGRQPVP